MPVPGFIDVFKPKEYELQEAISVGQVIYLCKTPGYYTTFSPDLVGPSPWVYDFTIPTWRPSASYEPDTAGSWINTFKYDDKCYEPFEPFTASSGVNPTAADIAHCTVIATLWESGTPYDSNYKVIKEGTSPAVSVEVWRSTTSSNYTAPDTIMASGIWERQDGVLDVLDITSDDNTITVNKIGKRYDLSVNPAGGGGTGGEDNFTIKTGLLGLEAVGTVARIEITDFQTIPLAVWSQIEGDSTIDWFAKVGALNYPPGIVGPAHGTITKSLTSGTIKLFTDTVTSSAAGGIITYTSVTTNPTPGQWIPIENANNKVDEFDDKGSLDTTSYPSLKALADFTKNNYEQLSNKATSFGTINDELYPTTKAVDDTYVPQRWGFTGDDDSYLQIQRGEGILKGTSATNSWVIGVGGEGSYSSLIKSGITISADNDQVIFGDTCYNFSSRGILTVIPNDLGYAEDLTQRTFLNTREGVTLDMTFQQDFNAIRDFTWEINIKGNYSPLNMTPYTAIKGQRYDFLFRNIKEDGTDLSIDFDNNGSQFTWLIDPLHLWKLKSGQTLTLRTKCSLTGNSFEIYSIEFSDLSSVYCASTMNIDLRPHNEWYIDLGDNSANPLLLMANNCAIGDTKTVHIRNRSGSPKLFEFRNPAVNPYITSDNLDLVNITIPDFSEISFIIYKNKNLEQWYLQRMWSPAYTNKYDLRLSSVPARYESTTNFATPIALPAQNTPVFPNPPTVVFVEGVITVQPVAYKQTYLEMIKLDAWQISYSAPDGYSFQTGTRQVATIPYQFVAGDYNNGSVNKMIGSGQNITVTIDAVEDYVKYNGDADIAFEPDTYQFIGA
jgi:hypothetical protein